MEYRRPDRPPMAPLIAQPYVCERLFKHLNVSTREEFSEKVNEDMLNVGPWYIGDRELDSDSVSRTGIWGEKYERVPFDGGSYEDTVFLPFKDTVSVDELKDYVFPSPDWYDYSEISEFCDRHKDKVLYTGDPGHFDFINGTAFTRGVEQVLVDIALEDEVYLYLVEKRFNFFYEKIRRTLEAAKGKIDIVYFGDDLGTQIGPIISIDSFNRLFSGYYKKGFELAHSYGAKTMMHCCGSIKSFIPVLIELGLDILEGVQVDASGMDIEGLHRDFYKKIAFCGTISVQGVLARGTPDDVTKEVMKRKKLFADGGIIIGPSNIMQIDMSDENFDAMCNAVCV